MHAPSSDRGISRDSRSAAWRLAPEVSFCVASGDVILLDLARDRYFQLPAQHCGAFLAWTGDSALIGGALLALLEEHKLIVATKWQAPSPPPAVRDLGRPSCSLVRMLCMAPAVVASFRFARRALARRRLADLVAALCHGTVNDDRAAMLAADFCATARRLNQDSNCLLQSLALMHFLGRNRAGATLVFGVTSKPFKAHCWLQSGDLVLNDQLDRIAPFTPILVR